MARLEFKTQMFTMIDEPTLYIFNVVGTFSLVLLLLC